MFLTISFKGAFIHIRTECGHEEIRWHFEGEPTKCAKTLLGAKRAITRALASK